MSLIDTKLKISSYFAVFNIEIASSLAMTQIGASLRGTKQSPRQYKHRNSNRTKVDNIQKVRIIQLILAFLLITAVFSVQAQTLSKRNVTLMGSRFDITIVADDSLSAEKYIDKAIAEISRIENLISEWRPQTQISEVNRNAGIRPVKVDREVFNLTKRALYFSELAGGAFDISIAAIDKIWKFDGSMSEMPSAEAIQKSIEKVSYKYIILDSINSTIFLSLPEMKIGFGATGKGYAADKTSALLQSLGVKAGIVNASGDLSAWGSQPNGKSWYVGVNNPFKPHKMVKILKLKDASVTTSGSYEKYVEFNGKRYSHIINPKTGYPASGLTSVTVVGANAEFANGLSTSVMVLGKKEGRKLLNKFKEYGYIIITDKGRVFKKRL